jgi:hypothetical protein
VLIARHVLRALKHHVLEEVREPGAPLRFVRRTDVVPEVHRHNRQPIVPSQDDVEAVRQRVLLERQAGNAGSRWRSGSRLGPRGGRRGRRSLGGRRFLSARLTLSQRCGGHGGARQRDNQEEADKSSISHFIHQWHP